MTSADLTLLAQCERKFFLRDHPAQITLTDAIHQALVAALTFASPQRGRDRLIALATTPGIAVEGRDPYALVMHHAAIIELVVTYLLAIEPTWQPVRAPAPAGGDYSPLALRRSDGRLARVVVASAWTPDRISEECESLRTLADAAVMGEGVTLTLITLGTLRDGRRHSPWAAAYSHPRNHLLRSEMRSGEVFGKEWKRVWREDRPAMTPGEWLGMMQADGVFARVVQTVTVAAPDEPTAADVRQLITRGEEFIGPGEMNRTSCWSEWGGCPRRNICYKKSPTQ